MHHPLLTATVALALVAPLAMAAPAWSETSTGSGTTAQARPADPAYSSSRIDQHFDAHDNVLKRTGRHDSAIPATGAVRSNSSTTQWNPPGSRSTVEHAHTREGGDRGAAVTDERTTSTTFAP